MKQGNLTRYAYWLNTKIYNVKDPVKRIKLQKRLFDLMAERGVKI